MSFNGPCKGPIKVHVQVHGTSQTLAVPSNFKGADGWVTFQHINLLVVPVGEKKNVHQSLSSTEVFDPNKNRWSFILDTGIAVVPYINSLYHNIYLIEDLAQLNLDILIKVGTYAHVQVDYLTCFSDCKCFWLVSKTLECSNKEPKKLFYGVAANEINWSWAWTA